MNGMLGKPVALRELLDAIAQHVWPNRSEPSSDRWPPRRRAMPAVPAILSAARLDELRATLPADTLANLVEECLFDLSERLILLLEAVRQQVPEQIVAHAHAMAGMAAEYGMATLEARLRALMQTMGRTPNPPAFWLRTGGRTVPCRRRHARGLSHRNGLSVQAMSIFWSDHACMLSPATLSAFSTGMAQSGFGQTSPVHRVRGSVISCRSPHRRRRLRSSRHPRATAMPRQADRCRAVHCSICPCSRRKFHITAFRAAGTSPDAFRD